jgi:hypothetical protein
MPPLFASPTTGRGHRLADDIVLLLDGRVHASGAAAAVFARPPDADSARFLGWTVLDVEGGPAGIPPGALAPGPGDVEFELEVEAVVQVGSRWEAIGRIQGAPARVPGEGPWPAGPLLVSTGLEELVRFPAPVSNFRIERDESLTAAFCGA